MTDRPVDLLLGPSRGRRRRPRIGNRRALRRNSVQAAWRTGVALTRVHFLREYLPGTFFKYHKDGQ
jgi:hypothetical protein